MRKISTLLMLFCMVVGTAFAQGAETIVRVSHDGWKVTAQNQYGSVSGNEGGLAFIADENPSTFYHSDWAGDKDGQNGKQGFLVEMAESVSDICKITYAGRSDNNASGWASKVRIYVYEELPDGFPTLTGLTVAEKNTLFDNTTLLGTPVYDNNENPWVKNDKLMKTAEFEPVKGKYILFIQDEGQDNWLTCSDFQVYYKYVGQVCTVKYEFYYNDKKQLTQEVSNFVVGNAWPTITVTLPYGVNVPAQPQGNVTSTDVVDGVATKRIDVTLGELPFVAAESYNDASMKWYYLQFHASEKNHLYFNAVDEVLLANKTAYDKKDKDAYSWAFVGNPFDGYTIYNRKAYAQNANLKLNAKSAGATLGTADHKFKPTSSAHATKGFFLASTNGENTQRFNRQGGKVVYWSNADAGSTFTVVERQMGALADLEELLTDANALLTTVNANIGIKIGEYTQATAEALTTAINTANALVEAENVTAEDVATLQTAMDAVKVILPTVGQYYQIHSSLTKFAANQGEDVVKAVYSDGNAPVWKNLNGDDKSFFWKAVAAENGNVVFQNAADGKYLVANADRSGAWSMADAPSSASNIDIKIFSKAENVKGYEYGVVLNGWQMHCNNHGEGANASGNIVSWNTDAANSASSWFLVPVELQVFHDVTYNFVYGGEVKYTTTTSVADGANYPAVVVPALPYGVTVGAATTPEGTVTENTVVSFELSVEKALPFSTDTWCYAQMHANGSVTAYIQDTNEATNVDWNDHVVEATEIDAHLWKFVGDIWSGIKVINKATGRAIVSTSGAAVLGDVANATAFVPTNSQAGGNWFCLKYPKNNQYLNAQGNQEEGKGTVNAWTDNDNGSSLKLTEYKEHNVAVSAAGYATLYLGQATYIPEGVEVYAVTGLEGGWADMTVVEGVLPANTGVILKNEGSYTFKTAGATGSVEGNLLLGSVENTYVEGEAYVLGKDGEGAGFFKATLNKDAAGNAGTTHFLNNANKAYLPATAGASLVLRFNFGGTTAIESVVTGLDTNAAIYDLSGRRVEKAVKGIYIQNGKKIIVK